MTDALDTSFEAVEAVCLRVTELNDGNAGPSTIALICDLLDMLRAVASERDARAIGEEVAFNQRNMALDAVKVAEAEAAALREALEQIERTPAWGYPERWETTPAEVRQLARAALKETSDGL